MLFTYGLKLQLDKNIFSKFLLQTYDDLCSGLDTEFRAEQATSSYPFLPAEKTLNTA